MASSNEECSSPTSTETASISQANNHVAVALHKLLAEENENVFFSPFSVSTALAMLFCGARDKTSEEMRKVLGYDQANIDNEGLVSSFAQLVSTMEKNPENYTLASANSVLSQKGFSVKDEYKSILKESFKALLLEVEFATQSEKVVDQINKWVEEKTQGMIPQLLDSLDPATVMVILNAVYFKGNWLHQFEKGDTYPQKFYNKGSEDSAKEIDMMHMKEKFPFVEKESFKALQLPYQGEEIAMLLLLPHSKNGLQELESSLTPTFIQDLKKELRVKEVEVTLPKFRLEYSKSLVDSFKSLGMNLIFQEGAHLGGISDSENLAVSEIIHKAVLIVNEEGTEAAAATAVGIMLCCLIIGPEFIVDHPFAFAIYDTRSDIILFMGRVNEL